MACLAAVCGSSGQMVGILSLAKLTPVSPLDEGPMLPCATATGRCRSEMVALLRVRQHLVRSGSPQRSPTAACVLTDEPLHGRTVAERGGVNRQPRECAS